MITRAIVVVVLAGAAFLGVATGEGQGRARLRSTIIYPPQRIALADQFGPH